MNNAEQFKKNGCVQVHGFIDPKTIMVVSQYLENKIRRGEWVQAPCEHDPTSKFAYYADPLIEVLLLASKESVEKTICKELIPTYSYARIYQSGEELKPHVDRPSCEVSVTVNVATKGDFSPIYMQYGSSEAKAYILNPGDAVIYKGCEAKHWRSLLKNGQLNVQFMLHYVDKNGPNAAFAKDKRPAYGMNPNERKY
jgi:hypothetical protein